MPDEDVKITDAPRDGDKNSQQQEENPFKKQLDGVETVLQAIKKENQAFKEGFQAIQQQIAGLKENRANQNGDYDYVTSQTLDERDKQLTTNILSALNESVMQGSLMQTYKLSAEEIEEVEKYAKSQGIGNLEAAYLHMNKDKYKLGSQNKKDIVREVMKERKNGGDFVPDTPGDSDETRVDEPSIWLKNGEIDKFNAWADENPVNYQKWLSKKENRG